MALPGRRKQTKHFRIYCTTRHSALGLLHQTDTSPSRYLDKFQGLQLDMKDWRIFKMSLWLLQLPRRKTVKKSLFTKCSHHQPVCWKTCSVDLQATSDTAMGARKRTSSVGSDASLPRRRDRELVTLKRVRTKETPGKPVSIPLSPVITTEPKV